MKLLIVAIPESVHTARWILQLLDQGWSIYLFPSTEYNPPHALLNDRIDRRYAWTRFFGAKIRPGMLHMCGTVDFGFRLPFTSRRLGSLLAQLFGRYSVVQKMHLDWVIRSFKPDLIHSIEFQHAGRLVLNAKRGKANFPPWIVTNYGSDVLLFGKLPWARDLVVQILKACDFYACECHRDVELARQLGFKGKVWPVQPNTGGLDLDKLQGLRSPEGTPRNLIMLKGYNGWSGRAIFAIEALKKCAGLLKDYKVVLFSWNYETRIALELAHQETGIQYELIEAHSAHETVLSNFGKARIYIGCGISDGISTSCIEAMAMGAFPIQSSGACCSEWFIDKQSGFSVAAENIEQIADAIRKALTDERLCSEARKINEKIVRGRLDYKTIKNAVVESYNATLTGGAEVANG